MEGRHECNYYWDIDANKLHVPADSCIRGGNVMVCFFSILFGGLNLGQAFPSFAAVNSAMVEFGKILAVFRHESTIDVMSDKGNKSYYNEIS